MVVYLEPTKQLILIRWAHVSPFLSDSWFSIPDGSMSSSSLGFSNGFLEAGHPAEAVQREKLLKLNRNQVCSLETISFSVKQKRNKKKMCSFSSLW